MDKLLIVDDEYLVREGIKLTVDWQSIGVEVVGTAENGEEGLKLARELKPDVIVTDVRMPVMDGLDMARILFEENADIAVLILSGYKDFENARRALDSGVAGFLLKPIDNSELVVRVKEVLQRLQEKRRQSALLGQFKVNIPYLKKQQLELYLNGGERAESAAGQLALLGVCLPQAGTVIYVRTDSGDIKTFISSAVQALGDFDSTYEDYDTYGLIISSAREEVVRKEIAKLLDKNLKTEYRFTVSVCAIKNSVSDAFLKAKDLSENCLFTAVNAVITEKEGGHFKKLVRDALKIIERDYDKKISIKTVSEELYISESHLMAEFKSETGKTFNDVLTDYRMIKAQELLLTGEMRVSDVAYAVGYNDEKYFGVVFRKYTGCTPREFVAKRQR